MSTCQELKELSSRKQLSSLAKSNLSPFLVSEDEVEGCRKNQTFPVKVRSLQDLQPFILIVNRLPCLEEEEEMARSSRP